MAETTIELKATARPRAGKGAARQARRDGKVPGVIYGDSRTPETISMDYRELWRQVMKGHFTSTVFMLDVEGAKQRVIPRDVQVDPVKDHPIHVDFLRIGKDGMIRVAVPVKFVGEALSPGLKRGGVLNVVRHVIEVNTPYDRIPKFFEVNLEGLEIGRSVHISAVRMPDGISPIIRGRDFTIATIAGAVKQEEETTVTTAATAEGAAPAVGPDGKPVAVPAAAAAGGKDAKAPAAGAKGVPAAPAAKAGGDKKK